MECDTRSEAGGKSSGGDQVHELVEATEAIAKGNYYKDMSVELQGELGRLAEFINVIRGGMRNVQVQARFSSQRIPEASLELNDIKDVTQNATNRVLEQTETVMSGQRRMRELLEGLRKMDLPGAGEKLEEMGRLVETNDEALVSTMAALSFQDMTGQRITRIIKVVDEVETRILEMLLHLGAQMDEKDTAQRKLEMLQRLKESRGDKDLKQDIVDTILTDLGLS